MQVTIDSGEVLTLEDANNKAVRAKLRGFEYIAKFGDDLSYDSAVNYYNATNDSKKLTVNNDSATSAATIYMNNWDGSDNTAYNNIEEVDASTFTGSLKIAGHNDNSDTLSGGSGSSSLWGGFGGDDLMVGGSGKNTYYYLFGDGNDTITSAKSNDVVDLLGISLDNIDIAKTIENSNNSSINISFKDGGNLKVQGSDLSNVFFKTDSGTWKLNRNNVWHKS